MEKKLHRIPEQAVVGGVAAGIAQYMQIDVVIIRVLMVVMLILPIPPSFGWTGLLYIILWAVLPTGPAYSTPLQGDSFRDNLPNFDPFGDKKKSDQTIMILGGALVFFGIVMLVDDLPIWYQVKRYFWPLLLISIGAFLILRQRDQRNEESNGFSSPPPTNPTPPSPETTWTGADTPDSTIPKEKGDDDEAQDDDSVIRVN
ncbi:phage shock protein PspC (stress-responsive transcriptional regulator) [Dyadobacter jejuensis]|uniref:Phage shock protein PspC (Stress-responsive transcriptional regulator) n=1 Tax=Dyadobacter jejuensis TaxID=1082580 RepID=A0A316AHV2_9BACT|nr:PspC domain-containing protein [Dyadobacter jejuensis]PWJ57221.1 phage shock protein PspC (stress-responsive transcriptional regulator) [Dyadobacter jejuensis]